MEVEVEVVRVLLLVVVVVTVVVLECVSKRDEWISSHLLVLYVTLGKKASTAANVLAVVGGKTSDTTYILRSCADATGSDERSSEIGTNSFSGFYPSSTLNTIVYYLPACRNP